MNKMKAVNTRILQKNFPQEYHKFFAENELVVSTACDFMLAGEYSAYHGGISICQKVPFRLYAGLKPISAKKINIKRDCLMYDRSKNKFIPVSLQEEEFEKINSFINHNFKAQISKMGGCQIVFLSETGEEESFSLICTICALISLILHLYYYSFGKKDLKKWSKLRVEQLIKIDKWFDRIFRQAWRINAAARDGITSGTNAFVSLLKTGGFPVIYCAEEKLLDKLKKNQFKSISYTGERMVDALADISPRWYFDFGLIQFGTFRFTGAAKNRELKRIEKELEKIKEDKLIKNLPLKKINSLFARYSQEENFWYIFAKIFDLISLQMLLGLRNIFQYGPSKQDFNFLTDSFSQHWYLFKILDLDMPAFDPLSQILQKHIGEKNPKKAKFKTVGWGRFMREGCLIFIVPRNSLLGKEKILEKELKERWGPDTYIGYLSWLDGVKEDDGVKIEQDLRKGLYSKFVSRNEVKIKEYMSSFRPVNRLISKDDLGQKLKKIDLVLDKTENKIYIGGQRLTSKEIFSAKATISAFCQLLNKKGRISNEEMRPSPYSTNRYEFAGKIALPLKKSYKKILKQDLGLKVEGKIYHYQVIFDPSRVRLWVIDRPY